MTGIRGIVIQASRQRFAKPGATILLLLLARPCLAQGQLDAMRQSVRSSGASTIAALSPASQESPKDSDNDPLKELTKDSENDASPLEPRQLGRALISIVTFPFWAPPAALHDDFSHPYRFADHPYWIADQPLNTRGEGDVAADFANRELIDGYMTPSEVKGTHPWALQFSTDYGTSFDDLACINTRLLFTTSKRLGIDTQASYFEERLAANRFDSLWLGDCNAVITFAQGEWMQWRTGIGMNWMNDPCQTDLGFNFTYGFDLFPRKPWVVSAALDWGTLGRSNLFHFRTTVGASWKKLEAYTGYEYYHFDHMQTNLLIGGVRVFF